MKRTLVAALVTFAFGTGACATTAPATAPETSNTEEAAAAPPKRLGAADLREARLNAQVVAGTWLLQVDKGDYAGSWESAASSLQNRVAKGEWNQGLTGARTPFGALQRRQFLKTIYTNKLKPAGHHVVVNYHSQFANSPAKESVTVVKDADDQWRVIMYGIEKTDTSPPEEPAAQPEGEAEDAVGTP